MLNADEIRKYKKLSITETMSKYERENQEALTLLLSIIENHIDHYPFSWEININLKDHPILEKLVDNKENQLLTYYLNNKGFSAVLYHGTFYTINIDWKDYKNV